VHPCVCVCVPEGSHIPFMLASCAPVFRPAGAGLQGPTQSAFAACWHVRHEYICGIVRAIAQGVTAAAGSPLPYPSLTVTGATITTEVPYRAWCVAVDAPGLVLCDVTPAEFHAALHALFQNAGYSVRDASSRPGCLRVAVPATTDCAAKLPPLGTPPGRPARHMPPAGHARRHPRALRLPRLPVRATAAVNAGVTSDGPGTAADGRGTTTAPWESGTGPGPTA